MQGPAVTWAGCRHPLRRSSGVRLRTGRATPKWLVRALPADCGAGAHDVTPQDMCQSPRNRGALGLASSGNPIPKELDPLGRPWRLAAARWRHPPAVDPAQDVLGMGLIVHVAEVIQHDSEALHVRNVHVGKQWPDVLCEANCHKPTPIPLRRGYASDRRAAR